VDLELASGQEARNQEASEKYLGHNSGVYCALYVLLVLMMEGCMALAVRLGTRSISKKPRLKEIKDPMILICLTFVKVRFACDAPLNSTR
jgi:hypothetical protein